MRIIPDKWKWAVVALSVSLAVASTYAANHYRDKWKLQQKALQDVTAEYNRYVDQVEAADAVADKQIGSNKVIKEKTDEAVKEVLEVQQKYPGPAEPVPGPVIDILRNAAARASR